jgi:hypothetical protein
MNPAELERYKAYARAHPDLEAAVHEAIGLMDPARGSREDFEQLLARLVEVRDRPEPTFALLFLASNVMVSRYVAGGDDALEHAFRARKQLPSEHLARQDFLYWVRIAQIGRRLVGREPPGAVWTERIDESIRVFVKEHRAAYQGSHRTYALGGMISGVVFLAHQLGTGDLPLMKELIDWAVPLGARYWDAPRDRQADALLARTLEVIGVEFGAFDPLSRQAAFHGIQCFLGHAARLDEFLWDRLALVLARMKVYMPNEVAGFLGEADDQARKTLEGRIDRAPVREGVGTLLSNFRMERFVAAMLAEPPGEPDGLRRHWQEALHEMLSSHSMASALRFGFGKIMHLAARGNEPPITSP